MQRAEEETICPDCQEISISSLVLEEGPLSTRRPARASKLQGAVSFSEWLEGLKIKTDFLGTKAELKTQGISNQA